MDKSSNSKSKRKMGEQEETLGKALSETVRQTPLHKKLRRLAGNSDASVYLREIAVQRGCLHYQGTFESPDVPPAITGITNEELAIALFHYGCKYSPLNIRVGAQMLSAETNDIDRIIKLAKQERCEIIVRYIAKCGNRIEPNNPCWDKILGKMRNVKDAPQGVLPHWSRFVSMTGMTANGPPSITWLRPAMKKLTRHA